MRAVVQDAFGPPESLSIRDVEVPAPGANDVLVRIAAAALNPADWHIYRGDPWVARLAGIGLRRPRNPVAGVDGAGRVEAVGSGVTGIRPGDEVFGFFRGSFAEYALGDVSRVAVRPPGLDAMTAATLPIAATTALRAIRDVAGVTSGQRVLVNGAAGGVGSFAVQVAVSRGADVTGVCRGANADLVRSLGAAHVIDHTTTDVLTVSERYDVVLDNIGNHPSRRLRRVLADRGTLVVNGGGSPGQVVGAMGTFIGAAVVNLAVRERIRPLGDAEGAQDLLDIAALVGSGDVSPFIGGTYALDDIVEGLRVIESGRARGKLVVQVA